MTDTHDTHGEPQLELGAGEAVAELLAGFIQELRQAGLPVSLTENLDAMEAVKHIPLEDREAFKYALAATLVKNNAHWRAFETVFEVYFSYRGPEYELDPDSELSEALEELMEQLQGDQAEQGESSGGGGAMDAMTPEEIAQMLMKALQQGDQAMMRAVARQSIDRTKRPDVQVANTSVSLTTSSASQRHSKCLGYKRRSKRPSSPNLPSKRLVTSTAAHHPLELNLAAVATTPRSKAGYV